MFSLGQLDSRCRICESERTDLVFVNEMSTRTYACLIVVSVHHERRSRWSEGVPYMLECDELDGDNSEAR